MLKLLHRKLSDGQLHPTLIIRFDLGATNDVSLSLYRGRSKGDENVFILHAKDYDQSLFDCLKKQQIREYTVSRLLHEIKRKQLLPPKQKQLADDNKHLV